ncbi:winged helix-turn-helix domain-containing protein [Myxococcaceae bacterium JPH2]|nr:winged helix-turn-helix domain-containing protein [Myxococcaceae bacterium JPH2]
MDASDNERLTSPAWTFLTNHAHVLLCIAADPEIRLRDVSERVGITERAVQRIVSDLEEAGYLLRAREGRRNHYTVRGDLPLRHPVEQHHNVSVLLALATPPLEAQPARAVNQVGRPTR